MAFPGPAQLRHSPATTADEEGDVFNPKIFVAAADRLGMNWDAWVRDGGMSIPMIDYLDRDAVEHAVDLGLAAVPSDVTDEEG